MSRAKRVAAVAVLLGWTVLPAAAWDGSMDTAVASRYLWRGMIVNDQPVLQQSLALSQGGFEAGVWANFDLTGEWGRRFEYSEIDYSASYTLALGDAEITLTGYRYTYADTAAPPTTEVWASVRWSTVLEPTLTVVRDVDAVGGSYFLLTVSQRLGLLQSAASDGLILGAGVGRGDRDYTCGYFPDGDVTNVTDYAVRLDWPVALGPGELSVGLQLAGFTSSRARVEGVEGARASVAGSITYSLPFGL